MKVNIFMVLFLLFYKGSGELNSDISQVDRVLIVQEDDSVLLPCFLSNDQLHRVLWYKQALGEKPVVIVSSYHQSQPNEFSPEFKKRFNAARATNSFNLTIQRTLKSDSGTYYCGGAFTNIISFGAGTVLLVKDAGINRPAILQQPAVGVIKPGSNVTLQCLVQAKTCDKGAHLVYWFRKGSRESEPGMVYSDGNRIDQCEKFGDTHPTQSCFYNLPKMNVNLTDSGTYFCAVVTCEEILFGNGTNLKIEDEPSSQNLLHFISIGLVVLCAVSLAINILLCLPAKRKGRTPQQVQTNNPETSRVQYQISDDINYAAVKFGKSGRVQNKTSFEETLYSGLMS